MSDRTTGADHLQGAPSGQGRASGTALPGAALPGEGLPEAVAAVVAGEAAARDADGTFPAASFAA
ncbi:hypothetical protein QOL99_15070, partial [Deinococcus sp. MIMF12]